MEQDLRTAKNAGRSVRFSIAVETSFTNELGEVEGVPVEFDKGDVKIELENGRSPWLAKAFIVAHETLA